MKIYPLFIIIIFITIIPYAQTTDTITANLASRKIEDIERARLDLEITEKIASLEAVQYQLDRIEQREYFIIPWIEFVIRVVEFILIVSILICLLITKKEIRMQNNLLKEYLK